MIKKSVIRLTILYDDTINADPSDWDYYELLDIGNESVAVDCESEGEATKEEIATYYEGSDFANEPTCPIHGDLGGENHCPRC